jgi:GntR family transcriptional regulator
MVDESPIVGRLDTRLLVSRTRDAILEALSNGLADGGWLPAEGELTAMLGVSRPTLREALRTLEIEGVITRQRGVGTRVNSHVTEHRVQLNAVMGWFHIIKQAGFTPHIDYTNILQAEAPPDVSRRLQLTESTSVLIIERLFLADSVPAVLLVEHISMDYVLDPDITVVPESIFAFAEKHCRMPADHSVVDLFATVCDRNLAGAFGLPRGAPILKLVETVYTADGVPFIVAPTYVADHTLTLSMVRRRL